MPMDKVREMYKGQVKLQYEVMYSKIGLRNYLRRH